MVDRDLAPLAVGVPRRVVALATALALDLLLGPGPQLEHLGGHRALRHLDQGALVVGHAGADAVQAGVVGAALEHGVRRVDAGQVADRLDQPREVALDQLVLEGQGRGGDHDPAVVQERRHEVGQRLAGAGAGLDEQVGAVDHRVGDRLGHLDLAGPLLATQRLDGRAPAPWRPRCPSPAGSRVRSGRSPENPSCRDRPPRRSLHHQSGSTSSTARPPGSSGVSSSRPPWWSAIAWTTDRPRPTPRSEPMRSRTPRRNGRVRSAASLASIRAPVLLTTSDGERRPA